MKAGPDTFGGLFQAAPKTTFQFDTDRETIIGLGFTIIDEESRSGQTEVFVTGPSSAVDLATNDFNLKCQLPGWFFLIPEGTDITVSVLKRWAARSQLLFIYARYEQRT